MSEVMKLSFLILALIVAAQSVVLQQGIAIVRLHIEDAGVLRRQVVVARGGLSVQLTREHCPGLLASNPSARVAIVEIFEDTPSPRMIATGSSHYSFKGYLDLYDAFAQANWRSARCLLTPNAVVIAEHVRKYFGPQVRIVKIQDRPLFSLNEEFPVYPIYTTPVRPTSERDYHRPYLRCGFDEQFTCRPAF